MTNISFSIPKIYLDKRKIKLFFTVERDPKKRRVKPVESAQQSLLDFDLGESSDDSDFRIEDHCEESDDDSVDSNDVGKGKLLFMLCSAMKLSYILMAREE